VKSHILRCSLAAAVVFLSTPAFAQTSERPSDIPGISTIVKSVARDPATYAPAVLKFTAMNLDWESSQIFFRHGAVEGNARYTVSGQSNDTPISHGAGTRKLALDSLVMLTRSVPQNLAERAAERLLIKRFPQHRKVLAAAGRALRVAGTSYLSYASMTNVHQWRRNERLAAQMGYK
jgi:hypothetical protein